MAKATLAGTLTLALLAGCTTVEERLELRKPTAQLVGVKFQGASLHAATLVFDVEITNYYPQTVPLRSLTS
jgi:hypothetical protein